jgi:transposase
VAVQARRAAAAAPWFVPPRPIRQLREVARYRTDLVAARTAEKQRVEQAAGGCPEQTLGGRLRQLRVSGRAMLAALVAGDATPAAGAVGRARLHAKLGLLAEAFTGFFTDQHAFLGAKLLARGTRWTSTWPSSTPGSRR